MRASRVFYPKSIVTSRVHSLMSKSALTIWPVARNLLRRSQFV